MANIISTGDEGVLENGTYGASDMSWDYSWRNVEGFSGGGGVGTADSGGGDRLCAWMEMRK